MTPEEMDAIADVLVQTIQEALAPLREEIKALQATKGVSPADLQHLGHRLKHLEEQPRLRYAGVFDSTKTYRPGDIVTHRGSGWYCHEETRSIPGAPSAAGRSWQLMIKAGRDGKDAQ